MVPGSIALDKIFTIRLRLWKHLELGPKGKKRSITEMFFSFEGIGVDLPKVGGKTDVSPF